MANTAILSARFQISIPKDVRTAQGWNPGQEFAFIPKAGGVLLVPVPDIRRMRGIAKGARATGDRDCKDRV